MPAASKRPARSIRSAWRRSRPPASASRERRRIQSALKGSSPSLHRSMGLCSGCPRCRARRSPHRLLCWRSRRSTRSGSGCGLRGRCGGSRRNTTGSRYGGSGASEAPVRATRVPAPLQGDAAAASVDLYYALSGASRRSQARRARARRAPARRVPETGLVVPDTAVLYDIHGATWVYEDLGGNAYVRRRIEIARHAGESCGRETRPG